VLLSIFGAYYAAGGSKYMVFSCFLAALVPYKFITEISYEIVTPNLPLSAIEKAARKFQNFKEFFSDIFLFLFFMTLAISAWINILKQ
jgi:uncharacterized membrane protein YecN with MAPEG domain